jgi:uncharacterized protein YbjT (DUF2867 family)
MAEPVLVLGATGVVGRAAVAALCRETEPVRAATRTPGRDELPPGAIPVALDLEDAGSIERALDGVAALLLLLPAGPPAWQLAGAERVLEAARGTPLRHIVTLSGMSAQHDASSTSRRLEQRVEQAGLAFTHLRPNHFMQNYATAYRAGVLGGAIELYTGAGRASYVDARDVGRCAAAVLRAGASSRRVFTLTGPAALDQEDVARILSRVLERRIRCSARSHDDTRQSLRAAGLNDAVIEVSIERLREIELGRFEQVSDDVEALLGEPATCFEDFARDHAHLWS